MPIVCQLTITSPTRIGLVGNGEVIDLGRKVQYQPAPLLSTDSNPRVTISRVNGEAFSTHRMMNRSIRKPRTNEIAIAISRAINHRSQVVVMTSARRWSPSHDR